MGFSGPTSYQPCAARWESGNAVQLADYQAYYQRGLFGQIIPTATTTAAMPSAMKGSNGQPAVSFSTDPIPPAGRTPAWYVKVGDVRGPAPTPSQLADGRRFCVLLLPHGPNSGQTFGCRQFGHFEGGPSRPMLGFRAITLNLADPYGLHLDWEVMLQAAQSRAVDMFLNFPLMDMNRNVILRNHDQVPQGGLERMKNGSLLLVWRE
jgi:hypothetical protein